MTNHRQLLPIALGLAVLLGILFLSAKVLVLRSFIDLEEKISREHLQRVRNAIDNDLNTLLASVGDYAAWDETFDYLRDNHPDYPASNFTTTSLNKLHIDFVAVLRADGSLLHVTTARPPAELSSLFADWLADYLRRFPGSLQLRGRDNSVSGILVAGRTPLLLAAKPVLRNDGRGPVAGTLVMGRFLDQAEHERYAKLLGLTIRFFPYAEVGQQGTGGLRLSADAPDEIRRHDRETLYGYTLLNDLQERPALVAEITRQRRIYGQGVETVRYFMYWSVVVGLTALLVASRLTNRLSASRKKRIQAEFLYLAVIEHSDEAVILLEAATNRIVRTTPALSSVLGYPPDMLEGVLCKELVVDDAAFLERCQQMAYAGEGGDDWLDARLFSRNLTPVAVQVKARAGSMESAPYLALILRLAPAG